VLGRSSFSFGLSASEISEDTKSVDHNGWTVWFSGFSCRMHGCNTSYLTGNQIVTDDPYLRSDGNTWIVSIPIIVSISVALISEIWQRTWQRHVSKIYCLPPIWSHFKHISYANGFNSSCFEVSLSIFFNMKGNSLAQGWIPNWHEPWAWGLINFSYGPNPIRTGRARTSPFLAHFC
jgi:hypothetical protein